MNEGSSIDRTPLELWQAEWCPSSHRVRERLCELGLSFTARQVPAERDRRDELETLSGQRTIPVLVLDGELHCGEEAILTALATRFEEPLGASAHRQMANRVRREELDEASRKPATAMPRAEPPASRASGASRERGETSGSNRRRQRPERGDGALSGSTGPPSPPTAAVTTARP